MGILGFEFEKENTKTEYMNSVQLKNQNNIVFYDKLRFIFIELPKYNKKETELKTHFDKWLYFLKNLENFDSIPDILKEDIFEEAFKVAEISNFTQEELIEYEESLRVYRDNINVIETAKEEGREEGKIEMAIEMLKDGEPIEKIIKYSKLSEKEVLELKEKLG